MDKDYLITRLKRIFDQCLRAQKEENEQSVGKVIVNEFNTLLEDLQEAYPKNQIIQELDPVELSGAGVTPNAPNKPHPQDIEQVRMNVYSIADSLGIEMEDFTKSAERTGDLTVVNVSQKQATQQEVTVENLTQQVNTMMISPDKKEELKEIIQKFEDQIEDDPEPDVLNRLFSEAKSISQDVALKLAMKALERGIDIVS
jgi:hypothetical protein